MRFTDDLLDEFVRRWRNAFNETITRDEAQAKLFELADLYRSISEGARGADQDTSLDA